MNLYRSFILILIFCAPQLLYSVELSNNIAHFFNCQNTDSGSKRVALVGTDEEMLLVDYFYKKAGCNDSDFSGKVNSKEGKVKVISKNEKTGELEIEIISKKPLS